MTRQKIDQRAILSALLTCAVSIVAFFIFDIPYSSPTDVLLAHNLGGGFGHGAAQYLCSRHMFPLLSFLLYLMQRATGFYNIFGLFIVLLFTLSFVLLQITASKQSRWFHLLAAALQVLSLCCFTYTLVAYVALGAGILSLSSTTRNSVHTRSERLFMTACCATAFLGASLRFDVIPTVLILLAPTLFFDMMSSPRMTAPRSAAASSGSVGADTAQKRTGSRFSIPALYAFAALLLLWFVIHFAVTPAAFKMSGPVWDHYYSLDQQSIRMRDYPSIEYDSYQDTMQEIGWSENDLKMSKSWLFSDLDVFSAGFLKKAADAVSFTDKYDTDIPGILLKMLQIPMILGYIVILLLALFLAFLYFPALRSGSSGRRIYWFALLSVFLLPPALWGALYVRQRYVMRVALPFFLIGVFQFALIFARSADTEETLKIPERGTGHGKSAGCSALLNVHIVPALLCFLVLLQILPYAGQAGAPSQESAAYKEQTESLWRYIKEHSDTSFIVTTEIANRLIEDTPVMAVREEDLYENAVRAASQFSFSGTYYEQCRRLEIRDPDHLYTNLLLDPSVQLISSGKLKAERLRTFLTEHYDYSGKLEMLCEIVPGAKVYQYTQ